DAIADFEGLLGSSARKTLRWSVFSENGLAGPGGKSRNLQAADVALRKHRTMLAAHKRVNFSRLLPAKISITRQVTFVGCPCGRHVLQTG
ncbi:MAG: hypothetical protein IJI26_08830, partial [Clostridia bacterium]|nr:hypothetical protein [Clostridia bacterium]